MNKLDFIYGVTGLQLHYNVVNQFKPLLDAAKLIGNSNLYDSLKALKENIVKTNLQYYQLLLNNIEISEIKKPLLDAIASKYGEERKQEILKELNK